MLLRFDPSMATPTDADSAPLAAGLTLASGGRREEGGRRGGGDRKVDTGTITKTKPKTKRPNLYRVLLLNDDYTPMEFVVLVLQDVFNKTARRRHADHAARSPKGGR